MRIVKYTLIGAVIGLVVGLVLALTTVGISCSGSKAGCDSCSGSMGNGFNGFFLGCTTCVFDGFLKGCLEGCVDCVNCRFPSYKRCGTVCDTGLHDGCDGCKNGCGECEESVRQDDIGLCVYI